MRNHYETRKKRNGKGRGKWKDAHKKVLHTHEETTHKVSDSIKVSEFELTSPAIIHDNLSSSSNCGITVSDKELQTCDSINNIALTSVDIQMEDALEHVVDDNGKNQKNGWLEGRSGDPLIANQKSEVEEVLSNTGNERPQDSNVVLDSELYNGCDVVHSGSNDDFGDWVAYWDEYYGRNYYYNSRTHESTWEPPSGMEHRDFVYVESESKEMVYNPKNDNEELNLTVLEHGVALSDELSSDVTSTKLGIASSDELWSNKEHDASIEKLDTELDTVPNKRKKKGKRTRPHRRLSVDNTDIPSEVLNEDFSPIISKYWCQRYLLFSKYDEHIQMDEEGWFSVTPEPIARHHASRCGSGIIIDCFTGVGGNAIQFALKSIHIIAIDIDPKKIEFAQHNAAIYGVKDLIEFVTGDCFILAQNLKADTVFLSPPWGGPEYAKARNFDINTMLKPHDGQFLFNVAKRIAPRIVMFLPRNVDINQLAELSLSANPPWTLEVEKNFINGKLKAITAYFTDPLLCKTNSGS